MTLDDAVQNISTIIRNVCASAEIRVTKVSDEEARLTVLAPGGDVAAIKDAVFQPVLDLLKENLDLQVLVYDRDAPQPKGE